MFDHIVVPLDGSELSEAALAYAVPLAKRLDAKIVLLHADSDPYAYLYSTAPSTVSAAGARQLTHDYLRGVALRIRAVGVRCETRTEYGLPAEVILNYTEEYKPDLIAMSTHGRSGIRRMVVGSVTTAILPRAQTPILVVHPGEGAEVPETSFESLIVPLDMSERSEEVLPLAIELAGALGLNTTIITCTPSPSQLYAGSVPEMYPYPDDMVRQAEEAAAEYLNGVAASLDEDSGVKAQCESLEGISADKIVEYAQAQPNAVIAMCTQGRTGLGRMVLGSVTDAVIRSGSVPVLVAPHSQEQG